MKNKFLYKNIFTYSSLQFSGNVEKYFVENTEKLLVYIVMPRLKNKYNLLRLYKKGKMIQEKRVKSSTNIFLYYFFWYFYQMFFLMKYFSSKEKFFLMGGHPICFFSLGFQKLLRNAKYVYWIGDYFPGNGFIIKAFERLKKHYHDRVDYSLYLSDDINKIFNGKVINTKNKKTVMWGVKPVKMEKKLLEDEFNMLLVGLIKDSQGLDTIFNFLKFHNQYKIKIVGICDAKLYKKYIKIIQELNIGNQVYFPNKFFSDKELLKISKNCHVGIALYNMDRSNPTYYTDPGKVKAYTELHLPVVISNTSAIVPFVKKFCCGEVISNIKEELGPALIEIKNNYEKYQNGLRKFNDHFYYEKYYGERFSFLS